MVITVIITSDGDKNKTEKKEMKKMESDFNGLPTTAAGLTERVKAVKTLDEWKSLVTQIRNACSLAHERGRALNKELEATDEYQRAVAAELTASDGWKTAVWNYTSKVLGKGLATRYPWAIARVVTEADSARAKELLPNGSKTQLNAVELALAEARRNAQEDEANKIYAPFKAAEDAADAKQRELKEQDTAAREFDRLAFLYALPDTLRSDSYRARREGLVSELCSKRYSLESKLEDEREAKRAKREVVKPSCASGEDFEAALKKAKEANSE